MRKAIVLIFLSAILLSYSTVFAVEVAPRISDREIIKGLSDIRGDITTLRAEINGLRAETKAELNGLRAETKAEMNGLRAEMNARFDSLHWMFNMFITIALAILGFVLRMQWQMNKKQAQMETSLETQKDELSFLKSLIEKLLLPKGAL